MGISFPMSMSISSPDSFYEFTNDYVEPAPDTSYGDELEYIRLVQQKSQQYYNVVKNAAEASKTTFLASIPRSTKTPWPTNCASSPGSSAAACRPPGYIVSIGGFDTHSGQIAQPGAPDEGLHATLLHRVSEAVCAFQDDLRLMGKDDNVAGMTFSESGRTIGANASMGTDCGAAASLFFFGKNVNPGIIGANSDIPQDLNTYNDVPMVHDFRQIYASVLQDWFGISNLSEILYGDFEILPIFKGVTPVKEMAGRDRFSVGNFPNPVRSSTTITFTSFSSAHVVIHLMDAQGRVLMKIAEGSYPAGSHQVRFDRSNLPGGTYFYRVKLNGVGVTKKMLVM